MSNEWSSSVAFNCGQDHSQTESCNGHILRVGIHNTSDTVSIEVDGKSRYVMTDGEYNALVQAIDELKQRQN